MKITIIGAGNVGISIANNIIIKELCSELLLYDIDKNKLKGEVLDFQHAGSFHYTTVSVAESLEDTKGSDICIITAGARQREGESRLNLLEKNKAIFKSFIPDIVKNSPDIILVVVSNPVDILTKLACEISGLSRNRVFGTGTFLDTSRLRTLISQKIGVHPQKVHIPVIAEHGDSSVACISVATCGGLPLLEWISREEIEQMHKTTINAAYDVIKLKGFTNLAIGFSCTHIIKAILHDQKDIISLSTNAQGLYGITDDIFFSVPCILGRNGIEKRIELKVSEEELLKIQYSSKLLLET